jgi:acyl-CoA reductase-like NAD-dependent aldehyde dehydrogenase
LRKAAKEGGQVVGGERVHADKFKDGYYVRPAIVKMKSQTAIVTGRSLRADPVCHAVQDVGRSAVAMNNDVPQGLSSAIFTRDIEEAEYFLNPIPIAASPMSITARRVPRSAVRSAATRRRAAGASPVRTAGSNI